MKANRLGKSLTIALAEREFVNATNPNTENDTILVGPTEADRKGAEAVYASIRNDYAKGENGNSIFDKSFGFRMWGTTLKGSLPPVMRGFRTANEAEEAAFRIYKTLRY